ncbi:magnesium transporter [Hugenholtzia roseola]|uniref:magnesium transporter n=1 Tax=Hugenholtzia roseola TaxID=1002 RepID=UPI000415172B|nr:magnesium transporter [Hugenholtzia roseola]
MNFVLTQDFLDQFIQAIEKKEEAWIVQATQDLFPADISSILDELDTEACKYVINLLDKDVSADIISDLDPDIRTNFLKEFEPQQIAALLHHTDSDDAADILSELPLKTREEIIAFVDEEDRKNILDLLHYEEDSAGGLMAKELIKANINWNVVQCIEEIRRQAENVEKIHSVYVVDDQNRLLGRVSLKRLILSRAETKVADIYEPDVVAVNSYDSAENIVELMKKYDLEAVPVVNVQGELLGRITIDDVVDVMSEQAELERQAMSGISENVEEDDSVWKLTRARLPWLIIGMTGGLLGARFMGLFEQDLILIPALAFFIPLITATGGNVGIQSATLVVQTLAEKSALQESLASRLLKSLLVALFSGIVIAGVVFGFNMLYTQNIKLAAVVSIALFAVVMIASLSGTLTPIILSKMGINPAVASGPFITTANDLIGLAVYFSVARLLYGV